MENMEVWLTWSNGILKMTALWKPVQIGAKGPEDSRRDFILKIEYIDELTYLTHLGGELQLCPNLTEECYWKLSRWKIMWSLTPEKTKNVEILP